MNVAVIIPAYNAADSLPVLLERTKAVLSQENIFIVNDGSRDATKEIAEKYNVNVISHAANFGKGAALQTGFDSVLKKSFDAVITMDADLQHCPEDIPRFIEMYARTKCDVIIGSRLHNKQGMPIHRILSNTITTGLVRMRTGAAIADSQSGFRFIARKVIEQIRLESTGFEAETEFLIKAAACGATFGSIPIETIYAGEKSNMTHLQTTVNFIKVLFRRF
ncbi:MAG TPA: glycosyltransferase family 2 protein [Bacteroidetes bacterium]|nr:glycosyltransferase family 2 protein [Bacteroidota bacterium]